MSIEIVEHYPSLRPAKYILSMDFEKFRMLSSRSDNEQEIKALHKRIHKMADEIIRANGTITRVYNYSLTTPAGLSGRLFSPFSIQSAPRKIRGLLMKHTTDIDMKNAHPMITQYFCQKYNIPCPQLEYYNRHRDQMIGDGPDRESKKELYLKALNKDKIVPEIKDFSAEIIKIQKQIISKPEFAQIADTVGNKSWNKTGSYFNKTLCIYENKILEVVRTYLNNRGLIIRCLAFDGLMIDGSHYENRQLLQDIETVVESNFPGLNMKFDFKPHDNSIGIPDDFDEETQSSSNEKSFEFVAANFERNHCKITNKGIYVKQYGNDNIVMSKNHIKNAYEHMTYEKMDKNGNMVPKNFINDWMTSNPEILCYDDIGVYPNKSLCPKSIYNMWRDFEMENVTEYTHNQEALDLILNHLLILSGNDVSVAKYLECWIAQMIQFPEVKSNCPTFISKEGAGKGTLMRLFEKMLGKSKIFETTNPSRDVWGDFNGAMANYFLVNLNELSKKDTIETEGRIKGLITDPRISINNKGVNSYEVDSYHRFIITTNSEEPVNIAKDDRRKWVVRSSDELIQNKMYFEKIYKFLEDVNVIKTCYEYFKAIPGMDQFHKLEMPVTEYQKSLQQYSKSPIEMWLESFAIEHIKEGSFEQNYEETYGCFSAWISANNYKYECNALQLSVRMKRLDIPGVTKKHTKKGNCTVYNFQEILKHFQPECLVQMGE